MSVRNGKISLQTVSFRLTKNVNKSNNNHQSNNINQSDNYSTSYTKNKKADEIDNQHDD